MFFHSRSKRNVKRVSASLESFHFTRAKKTWPRRAAYRNVSSSRVQRADHPQPGPLILSCPSLTRSLGEGEGVWPHTCLFLESGQKLACSGWCWGLSAQLLTWNECWRFWGGTGLRAILQDVPGTGVGSARQSSAVVARSSFEPMFRVRKMCVF